jgi:amino acid transporter
MIWRIILIGIGLIVFFYGANLAVQISVEAVKKSQDPLGLILGTQTTEFVIALGLIGLGGTLIFVGAVAKRMQSSQYNVR